MNVAILKGNGRPSAAAALVYAQSARNSGQWRKAAEMFEAVEQLDPGQRPRFNHRLLLLDGQGQDPICEMVARRLSTLTDSFDGLQPARVPVRATAIDS